VSIHCRYCGTEYFLKKGVASSVLVIAIWFFVVFLFLAISSLGWSLPFNIIFGSMAAVFALYVTFRAGSLQKKVHPERSSGSQQESRAKSDYSHRAASSTRPNEKKSDEAEQDFNVLPKNLSHLKKAG